MIKFIRNIYRFVNRHTHIHIYIWVCTQEKNCQPNSQPSFHTEYTANIYHKLWGNDYKKKQQNLKLSIIILVYQTSLSNAFCPPQRTNLSSESICERSPSSSVQEGPLDRHTSCCWFIPIKDKHLIPLIFLPTPLPKCPYLVNLPELTNNSFQQNSLFFLDHNKSQHLCFY